MSEKEMETTVEDTEEDEAIVSEGTGGSDSDAPLKPRSKPKSAPKVGSSDVSVASNIPATDDEASEDNDHELKPWDQINLKPVMDMIEKVTKTSLDAAKEFNTTMITNTNQLVVGCDSVLLEIKHISDIRETMKSQTKSASALAGGQSGVCSCGTSMMPLSAFPSITASAPEPSTQQPQMLDRQTEDQTDRVLYKIEASIEKFRELAERVQAMSMQYEATLMTKLTMPKASIQTMVSSIHTAAAAATAAAIAQERGSNRTNGFTFTREQRIKLQMWYYAYPRPLSDELEYMAQILSLPPYQSTRSATYQIHPVHVRDWFHRRRFRERMRHVMEVLDAGTMSLQEAEDQIKAKMELRIQTLREAVDPEELVRELESARSNLDTYTAVSTSFGQKRNLDQFLSVAEQLSHSMPSVETPSGKRRRKGPNSDGLEQEEAIVVKVATRVEVQAIQNRLQSLLCLTKTPTSTNNILQVMDLLRSMEIPKDVRVTTGLVGDLKQVLKVYKKPSLLRRKTESLMEALGQSAGGRKKKQSSSNTDTQSKSSDISMDIGDEETKSDELDDSEDDQPIAKKTPRKPRLHRPMKFSMKQVEALEAWFQRTFKPSVAEMEEYLNQLNTPPLRDLQTQKMDVSMTQLRRWFNKRRCLRRPPLALMTKGDGKSEEDEEDDDDDDTIASEDDNQPVPPFQSPPPHPPLSPPPPPQPAAPQQAAVAPSYPIPPPPSPPAYGLPPPPPSQPLTIPLPLTGEESDSSSDSNDSDDDDSSSDS